ncbi:DUF4344 domain-containing metallopeptidase [Marinomonas sp. S3726]|uniref:DUF4344 domain-containing metallopeptidase n=1 Tax=Marinomonas sp. S3726 TaxID=579484 RepID=UPI000698081B|nr:DUF4344 domain-containing metallopeptidase [Marinomonas sp. S3726]
MRFFIIVLFSAFSLAAQANLNLKWLAPEPENQAIKQLLESSEVLQTSIDLINNNWQLEDDILLRIGGEEDPYHDPETSTIYFSYYFADEIAQRFIAANPNADLAAQQSFVISGVVHTLFHEYAHVLVDYLNLPVLGREEDAADSFASYVLITMMEDGPRLLKDGADLFYLESLDPEPFASVMLSDSHSLPIQRFYMSLCHLYASDEKAYQYLITEHDFDEEWVNTCFMDYDIIISSWQVLLAQEET